jgi:polar amino acid transport system substrate-binding protein
VKRLFQKKNILSVVSCTLFSLFIFATWSLGQQNGRIVMVTEEWPPFRINDDSSPSGFRGIDIDIVNALSEKLGVTIEIQRYPWARALEFMRSGQADMITGIAYAADREQFIYYIPLSYYAVRPVFYTQKGKGSQFQSYQDLYGPSTGYSLNSVYFEPFDSDTKINKMGLSTEIQLLKVLALGRLDIIIGTDPNVSYDISRLGYQEKLEPTSYQPPDKTELFIAISRKSPAMAQAQNIETALRTMLSDGTIDEIIMKYR